jgi:FkbM family methyltransferase
MLNSLIYLQKISRKALKSQDVRVIVEIGANKCTESLDFAKIYQNGDIYPFECNPDTIPLCKEAISNEPRIHLTEMAVSDKIGILDFFPIDTTKSVTPHKDGNTGASSLFQRNEKVSSLQEILHQKKITVQSTTLKKFIMDKNIKSIDILWLDAQGAELMILKGADDFISKIKYIQCEVEFTEEYRDQPLYQEIKCFLLEKGFIFCGFSDEWYPHAADAIFMHYDTFKRLPMPEKMLCYFSKYMPIKPLISRKIMYRIRKWYRR